MSDKDLPETANPAQDVTAANDSLARIVELARQDMRERGFTDAQIEVLLQRKKAPDSER